MIYFEKQFFQRRSVEFKFGVPQFVEPFVQDDVLAASLLRLHYKLEKDADTLNIEGDLADVFARLGERHVCGPAKDSTIRDERNKINRVKDYLIAVIGRTLASRIWRI